MAKPRLGVFKFSSCDGCQLSVLDCEDELLTIVGAVEVCNFLEASSDVREGPYDLALVEGSISTPEEAERIKKVREESKVLVAIGACATAGGLQALRNWDGLGLFQRAVYPHPEYLRSLDKALPLSEFVPVDFELRGCPISKGQLLELLAAVLHGTTPRLPGNAVCFECKRRSNVCVVVAAGVPCLGPVTMDGCGAICPSHGRGCYGCFGPSNDVNLPSYASWLEKHGVEAQAVRELVKGINSNSKEFREWLEKNE
jgi:coenzyme F420-reducing hydrogenase gamma subunit